jgi:hypothetical protein
MRKAGKLLIILFCVSIFTAHFYFQLANEQTVKNYLGQILKGNRE